MLNWRKHVDVAVGVLAFLVAAQIVGRRVSGEWGGVTLIVAIAAGIGAYLLVQRYFPESRG